MNDLKSVGSQKRRSPLWIVAAILCAVVIVGLVASVASHFLRSQKEGNVTAQKSSHDSIDNSTPGIETEVGASLSLPVIPDSEVGRQKKDELNVGLDPESVGWESEAFSEATLKQLKKIASHASKDLDDNKLSDLLANDFVCSPLRPHDLEVVFEDDSTSVRRWQSRSGSSVISRTNQGFLKMFFKRGVLGRVCVKTPKQEKNDDHRNRLCQARGRQHQLRLL